MCWRQFDNLAVAALGLPMPLKIMAVLFDSGDTLLRPVSGAWWPRPGFVRLLNELGVQFDDSRLATALDIGTGSLDTHHHVVTEEEEVAQFEEYHRIVLRELGIAVPPGTVEELAREEARILCQEPFADTREALEEFRAGGLRLGLVSNAWPSLERVYQELDLRHFFSAFVISSKLGCLKPDERIYRVALKEIGCDPAEALFVDDDLDYVRAAEASGMCGVVMTRYGSGGSSTAITQLAELRSIIWPGRSSN
jgi:putative hydrolase of the HAD superfamily